ncbi:MAG: FTR1 family protein [Dehalococcoidales bacterium]|nr:FTR1 family protein [Dehalococcoidales bacterium]
MINALLITLREGLEIALIVVIILGYLAKTGNRQGFRPVWLGTGLAIVVSAVVGGAIYFTSGELQGKAEQIFEGTAVLTAAAVLTWMIFWMRRESAGIRTSLQSQIQTALNRSSSGALVLMAFIAVVREGIELALFLFAATSTVATPLQTLTGGIIGIAIAVVMGYLIYKGSTRLNLRVFFNLTGALLILFAAGLLARGIHEFQEAGILPVSIEHVWDIGGILPDGSGFGSFLAAIFGYSANPSLLQVIGYLGYLVVFIPAYFYRGKPQQKQVSA